MSCELKHRLAFILIFAAVFALIVRHPKACLITFGVIMALGNIVDTDHEALHGVSPTAVFVDHVSGDHRSSYNYPGPFPANVVTATVRNTSANTLDGLWLGCRVTESLYDTGNPNIYEGKREYAVVMAAVTFSGNPAANRPLPDGQATQVDFTTKHATENAGTETFSTGVDDYDGTFSDCVLASGRAAALALVRTRIGDAAANGRWIERTANLPQGY